ncbi:DUF3040 domain-containing protein [Nocardioides insulae]|uniref:DUF3040 domain-containing protein n=1 Tax=Nocardioides insulae TaxID=394734 RepID=UPI00048C7EBA|nr:DUF3040 domain-containing protein [Nocardioides insulae]
MPLSEEELRLLEQMERALVEEDPKFASTLGGTAFRRSARRRAALAGVIFVAGVALLMTSVIIQLPAIGIVGFLVMLASATWGLIALRGKPTSAVHRSVPDTPEGLTVIDGGRASHGKGSHGKTGKLGKTKRTSSGSFMERMEQRWRRRREGGGW